MFKEIAFYLISIENLKDQWKLKFHFCFIAIQQDEVAIPEKTVEQINMQRKRVINNLLFIMLFLIFVLLKPPKDIRYVLPYGGYPGSVTLLAKHSILHFNRKFFIYSKYLSFFTIFHWVKSRWKNVLQKLYVLCYV